MKCCVILSGILLLLVGSTFMACTSGHRQSGGWEIRLVPPPDYMANSELIDSLLRSSKDLMEQRTRQFGGSGQIVESSELHGDTIILRFSDNLDTTQLQQRLGYTRDLRIVPLLPGDDSIVQEIIGLNTANGSSHGCPAGSFPFDSTESVQYKFLNERQTDSLVFNWIHANDGRDKSQLFCWQERWNKSPLLNNDHFQRLEVPDLSPSTGVFLHLNDEGSRRLKDYTELVTSQYICLGILLDGKLYTYTQINSDILGYPVQIGIPVSSSEEKMLLRDLFREGTTPIPLRLVSAIFQE